MNRYMHDYVHMLTQKCGMNPLFAQHFIPFSSPRHLCPIHSGLSASLLCTVLSKYGYKQS